MATNVEVIADALGLLGVLHVAQPISAEDGQLGLRVMNEMLAEWEADTLDLGYFEQDDIDADSPLESSDLPAVKYNLAVNLAPHFGRSVTVEVGAMAVKYLMRLKRDAAIAAVPEADTSHLPAGEGQYGSFDIVNG